MTTTPTIQSIPRAALGGYLRALRLPLTAVERAAGQHGNEQWPPALAFEGFEANVETIVGALLRDPALVDKGRLRQAKVAQLRSASQLETLAEQEREQADRTRHERHEQAERHREDAEARALQRKRELERQAAVRERKAADRAAKKTAAVRRTKATQDRAVERQARASKSASLDQQARAVAVSQQALEAERTVEVIDDTIEGTKAARATS